MEGEGVTPGRRAAKRKIVGQRRAIPGALSLESTLLFPDCSAVFKDAVRCCSDPDLRENEASGNISGAGSHAFAVFISSFGFEHPHTCKNSSPSVDSCIVVCAVFNFFVLKTAAVSHLLRSRLGCQVHQSSFCSLVSLCNDYKVLCGSTYT